MKLDTLLTAAWLASTATAIGPANPDAPPRLKGAPAKMASWRFPNPFTSPRHKLFTPTCTSTRTLKAQQYLLDDLAEVPPQGLLPYRDALKQVFSSRQYPGSWEGIDPHGYDRVLLGMDYEEVPMKVREWIEEQERTDGEGKGLFAVYGKPQKEGSRVLNTINVPRETPVPGEWRERDANRIMVFAPGALYEVLPMFVAEGSDCEGEYRVRVFDLWLGVCLLTSACRDPPRPVQVQRRARRRRRRRLPYRAHQAQPRQGPARHRDHHQG